MNALLIPVRSITGAKNRLARDLDERARTRLTLAMLTDMIAAARGARRLDAVYVVSADHEVLSFAEARAAEGLPERSLDASPSDVIGRASVAPSGGLNRAVHTAARDLSARGVLCLLTIPGDVPLITPAEIDGLFHAGGPQVILVRSESGTGTNGLLASPPDVITPRFEGNSLAAHSAACAAAGIDCRTVELPGFSLDIDTFDDVRALALKGSATESGCVARDLVAAHDARSGGTARASFAASAAQGNEA